MTARNPRRAYDKDGREIEPMTLGNMRSLGVRSVLASCERCQHEAGILVDAWPDDLPVPDVALRLRCSARGSKAMNFEPGMRSVIDESSLLTQRRHA